MELQLLANVMMRKSLTQNGLKTCHFLYKILSLESVSRQNEDPKIGDPLMNMGTPLLYSKA